MLKRGLYTEMFNKALAGLNQELANCGKLNLLSQAVHAEDFYLRLLNRLYGWNLVNENERDPNAAAVDLIDEGNSLFVQVTITCSPEKVNRTLCKRVMEHYAEQNHHAKFLFVGGQPQNPSKIKKSKAIKNPYGVKFDQSVDLLFTADLVERFTHSDVDLQKEILRLIALETGDQSYNPDFVDAKVIQSTNAHLEQKARTRILLNLPESVYHDLPADIIDGIVQKLRNQHLLLLYGSRGVGKSEAALCYCRNSDFDTVWINCSTTQFINEGLTLFITEFAGFQNDIDTCDLKSLAKHLILSMSRTVFVFDDCNDYCMIDWIKGIFSSIRMNNCDCRCIITTYHETSQFEPSQKMHIRPLKTDEGCSLFLSQICDTSQHEEAKKHMDLITEIVEFCGGIPLAIIQSTHYFTSTKLYSRKHFMHYICAIKKEASRANVGSVPDLGIYSTISETYNLLKAGTEHDSLGNGNVTLSLLHNAAFIDCYSISMLTDYSSEYGRAAITLLEYGIIKSDGSKYIIPGVIQQAIRMCMTPVDRRNAIHSIISAIIRRLKTRIGGLSQDEQFVYMLRTISYLSSTDIYEECTSVEERVSLDCTIARFLLEIGNDAAAILRYKQVLKCRGINPLIKIEAEIGLGYIDLDRSRFRQLQRRINVVSRYFYNQNQTDCKQYIDLLYLKAKFYQKSRKYQTALNAFNEILSFLSISKSGDYLFLDDTGNDTDEILLISTSTLNGIATTYLQLDQYENAYHYFIKALSPWQSFDDEYRLNYPNYVEMLGDCALVMMHYGNQFNDIECFEYAERMLIAEELVLKELYNTWLRILTLNSTHIYIPDFMRTSNSVSLSHLKFYQFAINRFNFGQLYYLWGQKDKCIEKVNSAKCYFLEAKNILKERQIYDYTDIDVVESCIEACESFLSLA